MELDRQDIITDQEALEPELEEKDMEEELTFRSQMRRGDFQMLRHFYMYKIKPGMMRNLYLIFGAAAVIVLIQALTPVDIPVILYYAALILVFALAVFFIIMDGNARKLTKPDKVLMGKWQNASFKEPHLVIEWSGQGVPLVYKWNQFTKWYDTETHYFLFLSRYSALVIPKRDADEELLEKGSAFLRRKLG